jgi:Uma2 family endonuclease
MSPEEFLVWCLTQEQKWEYVDGVPVLKDVLDPATGMTGTTRAHDRVTTNLIIECGAQLRGGPCRVATQDLAVRTRSRAKLRRPDMLIECGEGTLDMDGLEATSPVAVFEVLSPSTRATDTLVKLSEYQGLSSVAHIVILEPDLMFVLHYRRTAEGGWEETLLRAPDDAIAMPQLGIRVTLRAVYDGVPMPAPPAPPQAP